MDSYTFGTRDEYRIFVANDRHSRERALSLAYSVYLVTGLTGARPSRMLLSCHDALPRTTSFLVERSDEGEAAAVASLTLIPDSPLGLPLDALARPGLTELRAAGRRPVELAKLVTVAATEKCPATGPAPREDILLHLFKLAYLTAYRIENASDLVIAVARHQEKYFRRILLFEPLHVAQPATDRSEVLAVPLRLRLESAAERYEERYGHRSARHNLHQFFINHSEREILDWLTASRRPLDPGDVRYFFAERSPLLAKVDEATRRFILSLYPGLTP